MSWPWPAGGMWAQRAQGKRWRLRLDSRHPEPGTGLLKMPRMQTRWSCWKTYRQRLARKPSPREGTPEEASQQHAQRTSFLPPKNNCLLVGQLSYLRQGWTVSGLLRAGTNWGVGAM